MRALVALGCGLALLAPAAAGGATGDPPATRAALLVLSNLERVDRGLVPVIGLSGPLDQNALTGAQSDADPQPTQFNGNTWAANWEGGYGSPLEADFVWMHDDGYGSPNGDCNAPSDLECRGHMRAASRPRGP